jgi:hypothetical protein
MGDHCRPESAMTPPDGTSNTGAARERAGRGRLPYDERVERQRWADRQAVVDDGLFPSVDVAVCPVCSIHPAPAGALCAGCAADGATP